MNCLRREIVTDTERGAWRRSPPPLRLRRLPQSAHRSRARHNPPGSAPGRKSRWEYPRHDRQTQRPKLRVLTVELFAGRLQLRSGYPNFFNAATIIECILPVAEPVPLTVYYIHD